MLVGVPKEIKDSEYRVGLVPSTAGELIANGHRVIIERGAGIGAGLSDADYEAVGRKSFRAPMKSMHARNSS
jgi:alanine dehydrogenase